VEAVAFAAAGYFFGKEVNRERAEKAEDKAKEKDAEAKSEHGAKERAATSLSSLIKYIETQEPTATRSSDPGDILSILRQAGVAESDLTATIAARFDATSSARDERWGNLLKFARSLPE
jgi:hypothetical protein